MMMMGDRRTSSGQLEGKHAVVTGGASGIGRGISLEFARQGAAIAILDVNGAGAAAVVEEIEEIGGEAIVLEVDVVDSAAVKEEVGRASQRFGTVDILVNCAGLNRFSLPNEYPVEEWESLLAVNLGGQWNCCQAVMPDMMEKRSGKIVNMGSAAGMLAIPRAAPYSIAKHGVIGLTRALAVDLGPYNINVNCICPATVVTPLLKKVTSPAFAEGMIKSIPLGRLGEISEIAQAALFLASSASSWITGVVLPVDGGLTCCIRAHHYE